MQGNIFNWKREPSKRTLKFAARNVETQCTVTRGDVQRNTISRAIFVGSNMNSRGYMRTRVQCIASFARALKQVSSYSV